MDKLIYILALLVIIYILKRDNKEKENFENTFSVKAVDNLNSIDILSKYAEKLISDNSIAFSGPTTITGNIDVSGNLNVKGNINLASSITADNAFFTNINLLPRGLITMWAYVNENGNISDAQSRSEVPTGWAICDGTNGTPDLRGRFIFGADTVASYKYGTGKTGGNETITLTPNNLPPHTHQSIPRDENLYVRNVSNYTNYLTYDDNGRPQICLKLDACVKSVNPKFWNTITGTSLIGVNGDPFITGDGSENGLRETPLPINIMPSYFALYYIMKL